MSRLLFIKLEAILFNQMNKALIQEGLTLFLLRRFIIKVLTGTIN